MTSFGALLLTSFKAIASLFLQYLIGATVAWFGIVKESDLRGFGAAMNYVFVPLLSIVALGRGMTVDLFVRDGWVLALIGFLSMFEFAAIGLLLRFVAKPSPSFRRPFVVATALPNVVAIPLSVTQSLCEMGAFDAEFGAPGSTLGAEFGRPECVLRSRALVFMYICFNSFNVWITAFGYLAADASEATEAPAPAPASTTDVPTAPPTAEVAPEPSPTPLVSGAVRKASLRHISVDVGAVGRAQSRPRAVALLAAKRCLALFRRPPVIGMFVGLLVGLVAPLQEALFAPGAPLLPIGTALSMLSEGAVPMVNLMLAFSLGHKLRALKSWRELLGSTAAGISPRTMITLTLGRMVLTPLCHGAVLYGLLGVLPQSRLLRVIVFVEMAPPTASMVVVLSHLANKPRSAQLVAWASIPQYLLGIVTLTLVIAFALAVTEPE